MGMFDSIKNEMYCPFCGKMQRKESFQTKNFDCAMNNLDVYEIRGLDYEIHHKCDDCKNWISLNISKLIPPRG
jgi:hypothetical protein